jgi:xanthine/CO dehydrogenase XdhC/CoxF family maturation factor
MDYLNLQILEQEIRQGNEACVIRIFDRKSKKAKRVVFRNEEVIRKATENGIGEFDDQLKEVVKTLYDRMIVSRKLADIRELEHESGVLIKLAAEILLPKLKLVVFGAGHVGQAVGLVGSLLGFDVIIIDDRPEFASRKRLPDPRISILVGDYPKVIENLKLDTNSAVVIVTRGHQFDESCLRATVESNAGYLGMIGSKRRVLSILSRLENDGYSKTRLEKVHAPIGLRIGAKSPQEIALAILAEVVAYFNGGNSKY